MAFKGRFNSPFNFVSWASTLRRSTAHIVQSCETSIHSNELKIYVLFYDFIDAILLYDELPNQEYHHKDVISLQEHFQK